jgi:hypothetical protein
VQNNLITPYIDRLWERVLAEGGFAARPKGNYRPDATAWAILALSAAGTKDNLLEPSRARLVDSQLKDGRVCILPELPDACWPTPLAILAWQGSHSRLEPQSLAVKFLINTTGLHWQRMSDSSVAHDTSIQGWSWTGDTHSWVEPTALSLIALQVAGYGTHKRAKEAARMLMDRQLSHGGWNYGNTIVFGQELRPMPENTGMALNALAGRVAEENIIRSLSYIESQIKHLRTPLSLGWSLLGLGAWGKRPDDAKRQILKSLELQKIYGDYETSLLGLLIVSFFSKDGLMGSLHKPIS